MINPQIPSSADPAQRARLSSFMTGCAIGLLLSTGAVVLVAPAKANAADSASLIINASANQPFPGEAMKPAVAGSPATVAADPLVPAEVKLDAVDLAGLYFYAKERNIGRVDAEIRRLQAIHPGFVPPADLYAPETERAPDESSLWALYEANDFTGIDAEIIRRKVEKSDYEPSKDFAAKLARKKDRIEITERAAARDWTGVLAAAAAIDPAADPDVDLVWHLADAMSELGDKQGLVRVLRGLMDRAEKNRLSDEHLAVTLQKALKDFPASEVRQMMATLWPQGPAAAVATTLRLDMARKEVAFFNAEKEAAPVAIEDVALLAAQAKSARQITDLSLMGWYNLKLEKPKDAEPFFAAALEIAPDPENAKGIYLSLSRQQRDDEAYEFAGKHLKDLSDDPVFLMNVLSPRFSAKDKEPVREDAMEAYSAAIAVTHAPDHGEILGWYAYNSRQFEAAEAWFRQAYDWEASEDRIKGLALTFLQRGKKREYAALRTEFLEVYPAIWPEIAAAPAVAVAAPRAEGGGASAGYYRHFQAKNYSACLAAIDRLGSAAGRAEVQVIAGWCHYGLGRLREARAAFEAAIPGKPSVRTDAVYGAALTYLKAKMTDDAEALIAAYPVSAERDRELRAEIYFQRARSAFDHARYDRVITALNARAALVAEPRDLTQLRGWSHYHMGDVQGAKAIFRQLDMHIRDSGVSALLSHDPTVRD